MFDPYRKWLSIPEEFRPPTHYQLLGVDPREQDREVIEAAVIRQSAYIRNFQKGPNAEFATQILNEIAAAKICLLDSARRTAYDATLKSVAAAPSSAVPVAVPVTARPPQATTASNPSAAPRRRSAKAGGKPDNRLERAVRAVEADPLGPAIRKKPGPSIAQIGGGAAAAAILLGLLLVLTSGRSTPEAQPITSAAPEPKSVSEMPGLKNEPKEIKPPAEPPRDEPNSTAAEAMSVANKSSASVDNENPAAPTSMPAVDLLSRIRLPEDAVDGEWKLENGELLSPNLITSALLQIPYAPPSDYRLKITGKRIGAQGDLVLGLLMAGRQFTVAVDAGDDRTFCGIGLIDGEKSDENGTRKYLSNLLGDDQPYTVVCSVRSSGGVGSVNVTVNGVEVLNWSGDPARLSLLDSSRAPHNDELFVRAYHASHRIRQIELEPLPAAATPGAMAERNATSNETGRPTQVNLPDLAGAKEIGLLPWVDPDKATIVGRWQFDDLGLTHSSGDYGRIAIPVAPQGSYRLHAAFTRLDAPKPERNDREVVFFLQVGGRRRVALLITDHSAGLDTLAQKRWYDKENRTRIDMQQMTDGVTHRVDCAVEFDAGTGKCSIRAELDGKQIVDWSGNESEAGLVTHWGLPMPPTLAIGARENLRFNFVRLEAAPSTIRVLDGAKLVDYREDSLSRLVHRDGVKYGLKAEYFSDRDAKFEHPLKSQVDPTIDFHWGEWGEKSKFDRPAEFFTVRWTGWLTPPAPGERTFAASAGDAMRIWLDDKMILDRWAGPAFDGALIKQDLDSRSHLLKVEYAEKGGPAFARLLWMPPGETTEKPIPPSALRREDCLYLSTLRPEELRIMAGSTLDQGVTFNGVRSPHGLFMHPVDRGGAHVLFKLPMSYQSIRGTVGLRDSSPGSATPLRFKIVAGERTLWASKPIQAHGDSQEFDVPLPATKKLELIVDCPGMANNAHAVWIEPQVVRTVDDEPGATRAPKTERPEEGSEKDPLFLSTLTPAEMHVNVGRNNLNHLNRPVTVNESTSPHGLFMHPDDQSGAESGLARVAYNLPRTYQSISGAVGINDTSTGAETPLTFKIVVGGRTIWKSKPLQAHGASQEFDVPLPANRKLELLVECPGVADSAHAVWIEPKVSRTANAGDKKHVDGKPVDGRRSKVP